MIDLADADGGSTLLDICAGTGTIGICCARESQAHQVIGVDICASAIECAKLNAEANGVDTATFVASRAELVLEKLLVEHGREGKRIVAVVDPPRSGLHRSCLQAIRNCELIQRLVYVSCNPTGSLVEDTKALCGPVSKKLTGSPFYPVRAVPVDLFPSTDHCEMVILFERVGLYKPLADKAAGSAGGDTLGLAAAVEGDEAMCTADGQSASTGTSASASTIASSSTE